MREIRLLLLALLVTSMQSNLSAEHVTAEKASQVAKNFIIQKKTFTTSKGKNLKLFKNIELKQVDTERFSENNHFYMFNLNDNQGWVIISDDDRFIPVLGYSNVGNIKIDSIPINMKEWLSGYNREIQFGLDNDVVADEKTAFQWDELENGISTEFDNRSGASVGPLLTTQWDQSPYYNQFCPYNILANERTVTGCVATAMAQVMKYWNFPVKGTGYHSYNSFWYGTQSANFGATYYDWSHMPNKLTSSSSSVQKEAVATLMYHCGVSVNMDYGLGSLGGSGAYVISSDSPIQNCAEYALKTYFGYKNTLQGLCKDNYTNNVWINKLKTDLNSSKPIIYCGCGTGGGHCFVCDGYDNNNYFHFNWGWSGQNDGYFSLSALNPGSGGAGGGSYSFTSNQQAIFGIEPDNSNPPSYDLRLYSNINIDDEIWFGDEIEAIVSIANYGNSDFNGYVCAAVFDENGYFVDYILKGSTSIQAGMYKNLAFTNPGSMVFVPGYYMVAIFYATSNNESWIIVDDGNYYNLEDFDIYYYSDIEVNSDFTITTNGGRLIQGKSATVNVDILNTDYSTFYGQVRVSLSNLDGSFVQTIQIKDIDGLQYNYHYTNGLNFTGNITAGPGTYHMSVVYKESGSNSWYYAGASDYCNPIIIVVEAAPLNPDSYETNNIQSQARSLILNWSNNHATASTSGSNIHVGNDIDYYKVVLPAGYGYTITPRLHDSYNSGNGQNYTIDAMFSYSVNGNNYSTTYDDVMSGNITIDGPVTVYFVVSPYYSGMTGTYLLSLSLARSPITSVDENNLSEISIYPNPARDFVNIEIPENHGEIREMSLFDITGKLVRSENIENQSRTYTVSLDDMQSGSYIMKLVLKDEIITKKIIVK
ncbi:MAG: thiol protease/hemagglutinin PrtT [Bacteroidia bacterium]|nr:thiol protease/hemagglutinin PrtT [Bacteroidia bacterium]